MNKYVSFFELGATQTIKNYKSLIGLCLFLVTCLIIFAHLWKVVFSHSKTFSPEEFLWYIALNEWVLIAIPDVHLEIERDLNKGCFVYLLPRPISYLGAKFAEAFGVYMVQLLVLGIVSIGFVFWWTGTFPMDVLGLINTFALGCLAGSVAIVFLMIIGISAFWLQEVAPIQWIWEKFLFMLGGLFLPIVFYPEWLQKIAHLTPFPVILGNRSALVFGFQENQALIVTITLMMWGLIGCLSLKLLYQRGLRILNSEGG